MQKKIIISELYSIAAIVNNNIVQDLLFIDKYYQLNSIYLGIVNKIFPSLNAAFINLDNNYKSGFIHYSDLHFVKKKRNSNNLHNTLISDLLINRQKILVQIIKESSLSKGPRLTTNLTFIGRYLVLLPFSKSICISRTVADSTEKNYLKALAILLKPATMGLLLKPAIVGVSEDVILAELNSLKKEWNFIQKLSCISVAPKLLHNANNLVYRVIRDFYIGKISSVLVDSKYVLKAVKKYLHHWSCFSHFNYTVFDTYKNADLIFEIHGIMSAIKKGIFKKVDLPFGAYIFIDTFEALTVIDVNSGSFNRSTSSQEAVFKINIEAAREIAYQLRIRNIAGLIIVDFIDMESQYDQLQLLKYFHKCLQEDTALPQIVQLSELGLVELTRRRTGKSLVEVFPQLLTNTHYNQTRQQSFSIFFGLDLQFFQLIHKYILNSICINIDSYYSYKTHILSNKSLHLQSYLKFINLTVSNTFIASSRLIIDYYI
uniref:Ribonuclease E n=1 Tax=Rhodochaete parvula TaxID=110510 RepID=A0A1X9PWB5_9RHOD|nr:ribonuclease E [Rhodochaete parvula]ASK39693.1 ribonuclease E [Rhodochaete parvula]